MARDLSAAAKAVFQAYADDDRAAIEALIADDLVFTSPYDNGIGRATYFEHCWPNHKGLAAFNFVRVVEDAPQVILTYECQTTGGRRFRNTEVLTIRDGQIHEVEVYFGWSIPHEAAPGQHKDT